MMTHISKYTTKHLVEELSKREGVTEYIVPDSNTGYNIRVGHIQYEDETGPACILVVSR
jgi:hypothetical protein